MTWPAITLDQALDLGIRSTLVPDFEERIAGDELEHARHAYAGLQVLSAAFMEQIDQIARLKDQIRALGDVNKELEYALDAYVDNSRAFAESHATRVEWRGDSQLYFENMEAVNAEIAQEFADMAQSTLDDPNRPVCAPFAPEIEPGDPS